MHTYTGMYCGSRSIVVECELLWSTTLTCSTIRLLSKEGHVVRNRVRGRCEEIFDKSLFYSEI